MGFFETLMNLDVALKVTDTKAFCAVEDFKNEHFSPRIKGNPSEKTKVEDKLDIMMDEEQPEELSAFTKALRSTVNKDRVVEIVNADKKEEPIKAENQVVNKEENSLMDDIKEFMDSLDDKDQIPTDVLEVIRTLGLFTQKQKVKDEAQSLELPADVDPQPVIQQHIEPAVTGMDFSPLQQGVTYSGQPQVEKPLKEVTLQNVEAAIAADKAKITSAEKAKVSAKRSNNKPLVSPASVGVIIDA